MRTEALRRHRPVHTCRQCRGSKVRCDRASPSCSRCIRLGLKCLYSLAEETPLRGPSGLETPAASSSSASDNIGTCSPRVTRSPTLPPTRTTSSNKEGELDFAAPPPNSQEGELGAVKPLLIRLGLGPDYLRWKSPTTRNRGTVSCSRCRKLKVRCDRQKPCARCIKFGKENYCSYQQFLNEKDAKQTTSLESLRTGVPNFVDANRPKGQRNPGHWSNLVEAVCLSYYLRSPRL